MTIERKGAAMALLLLSTAALAAPPGQDRAGFQAQAKARIMALDTDRDGRVSRAEWMAGRGGPRGHGRLAVTPPPGPVGEGTRGQPAPSRDLGGGRERPPLRAGTMPAPARGFDGIDTDRNGQISRPEWDARPKMRRGGRGHGKGGYGRGGPAFDRFDANRDGYLDAGEIDRLTAARFARRDRDRDGRTDAPAPKAPMPRRDD